MYYILIEMLNFKDKKFEFEQDTGIHIDHFKSDVPTDPALGSRLIKFFKKYYLGNGPSGEYSQSTPG